MTQQYNIETDTLTIALSEDIAKIQNAYAIKLSTFVQLAQFAVGFVLTFVAS